MLELEILLTLLLVRSAMLCGLVEELAILLTGCFEEFEILLNLFLVACFILLTICCVF